MSELSSFTDTELLQRVAAYDSKALEALYNRYSSILFTLIKKIVNDEKVAEDVLTDVFVIIWRKINHFDFTKGDSYTWLITLARNKAVDTIRRSRNSAAVEVYTEAYENKFIVPALSREIDALEIKSALGLMINVEKALNKLTDAQKYVLYLAYYEGLTQQQITDKLNIPLMTVKSKIKIALSNLRENLLTGVNF